MSTTPFNTVASAINQQNDSDEQESINPLDVQIGGNWYKEMKIQPVDYIHENNLNWFQGEVIKYVSRYLEKNGRQDLEKAIHIIEMLIAKEYQEG